MQCQIEAEELAAAAQAIGRDLADIAIADRPDAPRDMRYFATWGPYDLDCPTGSGPTEQAAMWSLLDCTD